MTSFFTKLVKNNAISLDLRQKTRKNDTRKKKKKKKKKKDRYKNEHRQYDIYRLWPQPGPQLASQAKSRERSPKQKNRK